MRARQQHAHKRDVGFTLEFLHSFVVISSDLRDKREIWRTQTLLKKMRCIARVLLTLPGKDPRCLFDSQALLRRLIRYGVLNEMCYNPSFVVRLDSEKHIEFSLTPSSTQIFKQMAAFRPCRSVWGAVFFAANAAVAIRRHCPRPRCLHLALCERQCAAL